MVDGGWLVWFCAIVVVFVSVVDSEVEYVVVGSVIVFAVDTSAVVDVDVFICGLFVDFVSCWNCFVEFSESKKGIFFSSKLFTLKTDYKMQHSIYFLESKQKIHTSKKLTLKKIFFKNVLNDFCDISLKIIKIFFYFFKS